LAGAATAMIDLSDGLSTDLSRILSESGVSARIEADRIPRFEGATLDQALHSGEDYELLITAGTLDPECDGVPITAIGEIVDGPPGRILMTEGGIEQVLEPRGWEHFG
jgi:thiamine-monophosphate kinase